MKTYLRHKSMNVIEVKELIALEYLDFEGKYKDYTEKHEFWEACYVESGNTILIIDGEEIRLQEKDVFFIPPEATHSYTAGEDKDCRVYVICFESSSQCLKSLGKNKFTLEGENVKYVKTAIHESSHTFRFNENDVMELLPNHNIGGQQIIMSLLECLIINLLRELSSEKNSGIIFLKEDNFYAGLTDVITDYLNENIGRKISLDDICSRVNYSRSFICKNFKKHTGVSLFTYFNTLKIREAERLLSQSNLSIAEISQKLGFSDSKYFCEMFKKQNLITPLSYREKHKGKR